MRATYTRRLGTEQFLGFLDVHADVLSGLFRQHKGLRELAEAFRRLRACYGEQRLVVIMDNLHQTHDHPRFQALLRALRIAVAWTPTEASWLNLIEPHFAPSLTGRPVALEYMRWIHLASIRHVDPEERGRLIVHVLERVLRPSAVAVVGATETLGKTGGRRLRSLIAEGFAGAIYPIHPTAIKIQGLPAYCDLLSTPNVADLAVLAVPAEHIRKVVQDGLRRGVAGFICITAGFAETGLDGRKAQEELVQAVRAGGARLIGPNSNGVFLRASGLNVTGMTGIPPGPLGVISQSGNVGHAFVRMAKARGVGISAILTIGNAADVTAVDLLPILAADPITRVICLYLEGFPRNEGERWLETLWRLRSSKPIIVVVAGTTEPGQRAIASHTGMLATDNRVLNSILNAAGAIRVADVDVAFDLACALSAGRLPSHGAGTVVLSDSGGPGSMAADALARLGVPVPELSASTQSRLRALVPGWGSTRNPVDFAGLAEASPSVIPDALRVCLDDEAIGAGIIVGHFGGYGDLTDGMRNADELAAALEIGRMSEVSGKPVVLQSINAREDRLALRRLASMGIQSYEAVTRACEVVSGLFAQSAINSQGVSGTGLRDSRSRNQDGERFKTDRLLMTEPEGRTLLTTLGFDIPAWTVAATRAAAATAYQNLGRATLAAKVVSPDIAHKSDVGGVILGIGSASGAIAAYSKIKSNVRRHAPTADWRGVLFTPMATGSIEMSAGYVLHPQMGPLVMTGVGGILVELLQDVSIRPAAVLLGGHRDSALRMIQELRAWPLLAGLRGLPKVNINPMLTILLALARLSQSAPDIVEVDLNPIVLSPTTAAIADVRVIALCGSHDVGWSAR